MKNSLPESFISRMKSELGDEAEAFFHALEQPSPTSVRLHHLKGKSSFEGIEKVPWCNTGYYLADRPYFHLDPFWHAGAYYVQEASSMILDQVIFQLHLAQKPRIWLDLCAAPGGKTGILASHVGPEDVLVANEVVSQRKTVLWENLVKGGYLNTFITGLPTSSFHEPLADVILIDAPCAGEGMMRKDPEAIRQWTPSLVQFCAALQKQIIHDAIRALIPGGYMIYSTCSYSMYENIQNVWDAIHKHDLDPVPVSFPGEWGITTICLHEALGYQLYPHKVKGEGLFIAVLKRKESEDVIPPKSRQPDSFFKPIPTGVKEHLDHPSYFLCRKNSTQHGLITFQAEAKANEVLVQLPGAELIVGAGQLKGNDFVPSHAMAMARMAHGQYDIIDLELSPALDYLERNIHTLPAGKAPGWYLIHYDNTLLGWAKNTGQGWKNHYPMHWRLRDRKGR